MKSPYAMATYNVTETITDVTESTCAEACLYSAEFKCLSFDFNFVDSICFLSTGNSSSIDDILEVNKDVNHFERLQGKAWSHFVIYLASSRWERQGMGCSGRERGGVEKEGWERGGEWR